MAMSQQARDVDELAKNREWWFVAEKTRSSRLDYLRKAVWKKGCHRRQLCSRNKDRPYVSHQLFTDKWQEHEGDPIMLQKANALAHVLDNTPIFITDQAQLVGYVGSAPHEIVWHWQGVSMVNVEIYNEQGIIPEPEQESLETLAELNDYWGGPNCGG